MRDLVDTDRELALLRELIQVASSGPGVEPLAAAAARMITAATGTDVCFVHVLDDSDRSLTLAGATPPFDGQVGKDPAAPGGWDLRLGGQPSRSRCDQPQQGSRSEIPADPITAGRDFTSMVSVPMETDPAGLVGVQNVHTRRAVTSPGVTSGCSPHRQVVAGAVHQARLHRQVAASEHAQNSSPSR